MKNNIYVTFVIGFFFIGCVNTVGTFKIKGKIMDGFTKDPIPGKEVIIQGLVEENKILVPIDAGVFSSDSSGYFSHSLRKIKNADSYKFCLVGDSDYSFKTEKMDLTYLERNAKYLTFSLNKLADLTIQISRKSKTPKYDTLFLSWRTEGIDGRAIYPYKIHNFGLASNSELKWIGGNVNSTVKTRAYADQRTTIRWVLFRNGQVKEIIDTITCKRDQPNKVYLEY